MQLTLPLDSVRDEEVSTIFERIKGCKSLPILSPLASTILKMCQNEETDASELATIISQDPGMAAQILFMANSGYYGGSRHKVTTIGQAVTLLGFSTIANLALSFCFYRLIKDMKEISNSGIDHVKFWRRSILASVAARGIGKHFSFPDVELMFLGALLQDIGLLALNEVATEEIALLHEHHQDNHATLHQYELERLGVDHSQVGAWLAQHWQLPEEFQVAILYSHTPELFETPLDFQSLVDTVALSGIIADIWINPDTEAAIALARKIGQGRLPVQPEDWEPILGHIMTGIPQIASFFHSRIGNFEDMAHIHQLALQQLTSTDLKLFN
ncbi:MAG: HDOD domain-containing protein [Nitrospirales bacterium]|nr:HDOD domain-containing protein [Nitrospira sp.]MDR4460234.1 HDOD domain-containing protein [Nitrospirales bacterium]MDR4482612.1 HDOD domain-containing protein [Nitrospirales bacterium]